MAAPEIRIRDSGGTIQKKIKVSTAGNVELTNSADVLQGNIYPENTGGSSGTGSQQTIAHGLGAAPTYIQLQDATVDQSCAALKLSAAADATNIYVTATSGKAYYWHAKIKL